MDYFAEIKPNLDGYYFDRLVESVLLRIGTPSRFCALSLSHDGPRCLLAAKMYLLNFLTATGKKSWFSRFKMTSERVAQFRSDLDDLIAGFRLVRAPLAKVSCTHLSMSAVCLSRCQFMEECKIAQVLQVLTPMTLAMLSADLKSLKTLATHCFEDVKTSGYHVIKLLETCLAVRADLTKAEVTGLVSLGKSAVAQRGLPPDDDELPVIVGPELFVFWDPNDSLAAILHEAFPLARTEAIEFLYVIPFCLSLDSVSDVLPMWVFLWTARTFNRLV